VVISAGGMGMAVARRLGQRHRVLLVDVNAKKADDGAKALRDEGGDAASFACDITDPQSVAALAGAIEAQGGFRALAHVAALTSANTSDWRDVYRVNWIGAVQVADALLPLASQGTAALFVSSFGGYRRQLSDEMVQILDNPLAPDFFERVEASLGETPTPSFAYQSGKGAMIRMCQLRARQWAARGARIVSMSAGMIATPMGAIAFQNVPAKYDLLAKSPMPREGTMLEIADAVEFLLSDRASFITGTDLLVDGGITAALRHGI
jgi:NAD(P)-dependent dehydrogenase (short-subunit alcohol dehydrogenase family)